MHVAMASDAQTLGRANEDFLGAGPRAAVLLDGAGIPGTEEICRHGVAWYAHSLGGVLLGRLSRGEGQDLVTVLGDSIDQIAGQHRRTCDIANPSSPQATVALFRIERGYADFLILGDSFLILDREGHAPQVVTDQREITVRDKCSAALNGVAPESPEYEQARDACIELLRASRNQPGGYWIAKDDPSAAAQAHTGRMPVEHLTAAGLLSNGASRIVDPYGLAKWHDLPDLLRTLGPNGIIASVRRAETSHRPSVSKPADDASIAYCTELST